MSSRNAVAALLGAGLVALAWAGRFVQDDAFISFRYARNLVDGLGLVWNPGERVEGYTNFLWTLLVAGGMVLGAEPVAFTQAVGLTLHACSLAITWRIAGAIGLGYAGSMVSLLVVGTNFTFLSYATGGLETPLVTALFLSALLVSARAMTGGARRGRALLGLSALSAAGVLTRLDTAVLLAGPALAAFVGSGKAPGSPDLPDRRPTARRLAREWASLTALPAVLLGAWFLWKHSYYGDLLPRSFYLKALNAGTIENGLRYFYEFIVSYSLAPFFFFSLFLFGAIFRRRNRVQLMLAATVTLWLGYVLKVGGDFMEFRFLAPVVPPMLLLLVWLILESTRRAWVIAACVVLLVGGSVHHAATFSYDRDAGIEPVRMLEAHLYSPGENWVGIGGALARAFDPADGVVIATTAAGAIPYYSGLRSVDMLGLNEPEEVNVAGEAVEPVGVTVGDVPGHRKVLTGEYLNRRGVHLVISHPIVVGAGDPAPPLPLLPMEGPPHLDGELILMPVGWGYRVLMLSIRPHPAVDGAVARFGWETRRVRF